MMESAGFRKVWELAVPLETLLMHRQNAQFAFVDEESFQPLDDTESALNRGIVRQS
jgi:hypothetical protein